MGPPARTARDAAAHVIVADLASPELDERDVHHLSAALRLRAGEAVSVTDGQGGWRLCRYGGAPSNELVPDGELVRSDRRLPTVTVGFPPVKGDRPEWAVQKLTELGVDRIVLMHTARSVVRWEGDRAGSHLDRLRDIARQAVMQSRGLWLPAVDGVMSVLAVVDGDPAAVALASPGGGPPALDHPTVLIGPEGGWSPQEETESGVALVSLGPTVLRTETAAVVAGTLLCALRAGLVGQA